MLDPKGQIGADERWIILFASSLMLIVVIPVIGLAVAFAWKYRASNKKAAYAPDWAESRKLEAVIWLVPCVIILALATLTWSSTHRLDPYRPIASNERPITIEVVALDWKWLFIYPELNLATINEVAFPVEVPVDFRLTSGSVMNSFFIPQLGSQIYTMAGMLTRLSLVADQVGVYDGLSANYSGAGFSDMRFKALAMSRGDFGKWVESVRGSGRELDRHGYGILVTPSSSAPVAYFSSVAPHLFNDILHDCFNPTKAHCPSEAEG